MIKGICLFFALSLVASISFAAESIEDEVVKYNSGTIESKIAGGRQMLLEKLKSGDMQKANEVYNFLEVGIDTNTYASFYQHEEFRLAILLKKYDVLKSTPSLNALLKLDQSRYVKSIVPPKTDGLFPGLNKLIMDNKIKLLAEAKSSLNDEEYDFEELLIEVMICSNDQERKKYKSQSERYIAKYPESKYNDLIRRSIQCVYTAGDSGFELYFGLGPINYTGTISNYIPNYWGGNFGASYISHNFLYNFDFNSNFMHYTSAQFTNGSDIWVKNMKSTISSVSLNLGYKLRLSEKFELCPYVGFAHQKLFVDETEKDAGFYKSDIDNDSMAGGLMLDLSKPSGEMNMAGIVYKTVWRIKLQVSNVNFTPELQGTRYAMFLSVAPSFWSTEKEKN